MCVFNMNLGLIFKEITDFNSLVVIFIILISVIGLCLGANILTKGSVNISNLFNISPMIVGLTIVSLATSTPELFTCVNAGAIPDLALGGIVGSNLANLSLILGMTACFRPILYDQNIIRMYLPFLIILTLIFYLFCWGGINLLEGSVLLMFLLVYLYFLISKKNLCNEFQEKKITKKSNSIISIVFILLGSFLLFISSEAFVESSNEIAIRLGVSKTFIGMTILALGTSLPELAACLVAIFTKNYSMSLGNIVGSCIFNITLVGGFTAILVNDFGGFSLEYHKYLLPLLLALTFFVFFMLKNKNSHIGKNKGYLLIVIYLAIIYFSKSSYLYA